MKSMTAPALLAALLGALLASGPLVAQTAATESQAGATEGEVTLAKLLGDRIAGEPQRCLPAYGQRSMRIIDGTALVFDYGSTIYVNIPQDAQRLRDDYRLVTQRTSSALCNTDIVRTEDRLNGFYTGNIFLNKFVPYKRPSSADRN